MASGDRWPLFKNLERFFSKPGLSPPLEEIVVVHPEHLPPPSEEELTTTNPLRRAELEHSRYTEYLRRLGHERYN
jgi:hypothetical protein